MASHPEVVAGPTVSLQVPSVFRLFRKDGFEQGLL